MTLDDGLLVHDFTNTGARWQKPEHQLISEALRLASSATACSEWQGPKFESTNFKEVQPHEITFVYNRVPPAISADRITPTYKEWGSQISDDELFTLDDLTEFDTKAAQQAYGRVACDLRQQNRGTDLNPANTETRRLDAAPLHQMIPQPHIYPSPFTDSVPQIKGQPFNRKKSIFLPPHSRFPVIDHARVAWLIPIRGVFPWNECSSGVLLDSQIPSLVERNLIQWNSASLLNFWSFLLELRKAASLGSLGVSLHSARQPVEITSLQPVGGRSATLPGNPHHQSPTLSSLSTADYIKVYHDASASFHVRRALDSWSYHLGAGQAKVRVLKGATLPLVDEISSGILLL